MIRHLGPHPEISRLPPTAAAVPADNGGRRWGVERRRFDYTSCIPERRSGHDRRSGQDRRCSPQPAPQAGFFLP